MGRRRSDLRMSFFFSLTRIPGDRLDPFYVDGGSDATTETLKQKIKDVQRMDQRKCLRDTQFSENTLVVRSSLLVTDYGRRKLNTMVANCVSGTIGVRH